MADIPLDTRPTDARRRGKRIVTLKDFPAEWLPQPSRDASQSRQGGAELPSANPGEDKPAVPAP